MSLEPCTRTFLGLPTELLILILSYLPAVELCTVQRTCHRIRGIVAKSVHLQYVLRAEINGVDDLLPPERPFSERLELLRCHERSWSNLQLKVSHEFAATIHQRHYLQDGYLIYNKFAGTLQYGYVDLLSASPDEELCWIHILKEDIRFPLCVAFAVDHNLAVVLRTQHGLHVKLTFLEFTTGVLHPLSSKPTVALPSDVVLDVAYAAVEVLGDYVLTTVMSGRDVCCFYLVSWKSGTVTLLREIELTNKRTPLWAPRLVDIDGSLIMLANCTRNSLEICKLELSSSSHPQEPSRLRTVCSLELPALEPYAFVIISTADKEWVSTASRSSSSSGCGGGGAQSLPARKRVVPFRSSKVGTIGLHVEHEMRTASTRVLPDCWMTISVPAMRSVIAPTSEDSISDGSSSHVTRSVPWADWGPAATRVIPNNHGARLPKPAGPFWIGSSPLVIRDYDMLRARCARFLSDEEEDRPTSLFGCPVFKSTEVLGGHWKTGKLETRLPYRDLVAKDLDYIGVVADREWIIGISVKGPEGLYYTIHRVG